MKIVKTFTALLLALSFLSPLAMLAACKKGKSENSSYSHTSSEEISETLSSDDQSTDEVTSPDESQDSSPENNSDSSSSKPDSSSTDSSSSSTAPSVSEKVQYIRCTGDSVNIRSGAGTDYAVLGSAEKGTMYAVIGKTGNWYKTYYRNKTAYIYASYVSVFSIEKSKDAKVENVISQGYKLLGVPYVYGAIRIHDGNGKLLKGFSTDKFDCSSLVQYIFYKGANKLLNVNTRTQVKQGTYVKSSQLKRGDCIFFTNEQRKHNTGLERIGHVALYLGDNYILHTSSDYARIEKISSTRWSFYIEARRFL